MKVFLDERPLEGGGGSLTAALRAGARAAVSSGRIIVEARLDGRTLLPEELSGESDGSAAAAEGELRLTSTDTGALVRVTLFEAADSLGRLVIEQGATADLVRSGRLGEAHERLTGISGVWQAVRDALAGAIEALGGESALRRMGSPPDTAGLVLALNELSRGVRAQDWSAVGDVLGYDLCEQAAGWQSSLRALAEGVPVGATRSRS